jgi:hypothetical protein
MRWNSTRSSASIVLSITFSRRWKQRAGGRRRSGAAGRGSVALGAAGGRPDVAPRPTRRVAARSTGGSGAVHPSSGSGSAAPGPAAPRAGAARSTGSDARSERERRSARAVRWWESRAERRERRGEQSGGGESAMVTEACGEERRGNSLEGPEANDASFYGPAKLRRPSMAFFIFLCPSMAFPLHLLGQSVKI